MNDVWDRVKEAAAYNGLTLSTVAMRTGLSAPTFFRIVHQGRNLSLDLLEKLAEALNVEPEWLAWGKDKYSDQILAHIAAVLKKPSPEVKSAPSLFQKMLFTAVVGKLAWEIVLPTIRSIGEYLRLKISSLL